MTLADKFWNNVSKGSNCWLWIAGKNGDGYGTILDPITKKQLSAHRVAWIFANGFIPKGKHVLHRCDTPACVNPDHLFIGTNADNVADRMAKGRNVSANALKTHCKNGHEFTTENTYLHGWSRHCRKCRLERDRAKAALKPKRKPRTHCSKGHPLENNVYISKLGFKRCRICKLAQRKHIS